MKRTVPKIQVTKNYDIFRISPENRSIDKIKDLMVSMKSHGGFLPSFPLTVVRVDGNLYVKDGQHRLEVAKSLGCEVYYVVLNDAKIDIALINKAQRPWSIKDYISSFANQGSDNYQFLLNFCEHHKLPFGVGASLLIGQQAGSHNVSSKIRTGAFSVKDQEYASKVASIVAEIAKIVPWAKRKPFVDAVSKCIRVPNFYGDSFIHKATKYPGLLLLQPTTDAFLGMIEAVYNHHSKDPVPLKFLAIQASKDRSAVKSKK